MLDHWREVVQSMRRNRLRTFLTACGVFWGVFMLVVMLGFGRGLERGATRGFRNWAYNTVFVWCEVTAKPWAGRQPGRRVQMTLDDVEAVRRRIDGVDAVIPQNYGGGAWGGSVKVGRKDKSEPFAVIGATPDNTLIESLPIEAGRFLDPMDVNEVRKVAVIGGRVRDVLFARREDPVGAVVRVNGVDMTVVGVFRSTNPGGEDWANGRVFVPRSTLARLDGLGARVDELAVLVAPGHEAVQVESDVKAMLKQRHVVAPDDVRAIRSFNLSHEFGKVQLLFRGIAVLTWIVGVLTLLAGAIGVSNIMMIAVAERTREIGVRKALGATPASITGQVVTEAVVLTGLAGYAGLLAAVGVVALAGRVMATGGPGKGGSIFGQPEVDLPIAVIAALVLTVAGALAGLAPARNAVAVRPVEALAHE